MIIDAHLHTSGQETTAGVLHTLDEAGVDVAFLLAPFLTPPYSLGDAGSLRAGNRYLSQLLKGHTDRLLGFAVVNPLHGDAAEDLERAAELPGIRALKMVPTGWYPYDDCAHRVYEVAARLDLPILFHSGIFIDGRSGRYCRPSFYEAVRDHPGLRVTMAHLGWPWCDEANAVGLIDRINGVDPADSQFRFDISFGPPPIYREDVFRKAIDVIGPRSIQFGSDRFLPCEGSHIRAAIDEVADIFDRLEVSVSDRSTMMGDTASEWLRLGNLAAERPAS
ncbi:amidohydrolase family protein [Mesorhizobium sp. ArgA1]